MRYKKVPEKFFYFMMNKIVHYKKLSAGVCSPEVDATVELCET